MDALEDRNPLVGWFMEKSKIKKMSWDRTVAYANEHGLEMVEVDAQQPIAAQAPHGRTFDAMVYKLTKYIVLPEEHDARRSILRHAKEFEASHRKCVVVDPLRSQECVIDRSHMYTAFNSLRSPRIRCPAFATVNQWEELEAAVQDLKFPLLCKTLQACGSSDSHEMLIAFSTAHMREFSTPPFLVQEFHNHDATMHKVFVVGQQCNVVKRPSIRNLSDQDGPITFNSQSMASVIDNSHYEGAPLPPQAILDEIAEFVMNSVGLSLYGYDLIHDTATGVWDIVDLNFFPGFIGYPDFDATLVAFLKQSVAKHRSHSAS